VDAGQMSPAVSLCEGVVISPAVAASCVSNSMTRTICWSGTNRTALKRLMVRAGLTSERVDVATHLIGNHPLLTTARSSKAR
jgi:hypothetical protein